MSDDIRVFIGSSSMGEDKDIEKVYVNSILENASRDVDIFFMRQTMNKDSFGIIMPHLNGLLLFQVTDGIFQKHVNLKVEQSIQIVI